ncbi:alpha/beta fold hydrolase [Chitinophaga pinensis]|uniref:alpha/beta fold hydrolase n=1 Tax=Chitinophaga pinensis TaxID=79329 RepID=UPI001C9A1153|nr:alpha/beta fold hydrolase [Chitinophaga pinensis]
MGRRECHFLSIYGEAIGGSWISGVYDRFRGYGKSSGKPAHLNIVNDGQQVLNYLLGREDVKGTKVVLFGASIGTQVATRLARDNGDKIQALVLDGAVSSFTDLAAAYAPAELQAMIKQYLTSPYAAKTDIRLSEYRC